MTLLKRLWRWIDYGIWPEYEWPSRKRDWKRLLGEE